MHDSNGKETEKIDYSFYKMTWKEIVRYTIQGCVFVSIFGYFFYRSIFITTCFVPFIFFYLKYKNKELCKNRKNNLNFQFKEALCSINSSVQAGYSLENAFFESHRDMIVFFGQDSLIAHELLLIKKGIHNNRTLVEMLTDLGKRSGVNDIKDFASILLTGKQSGGNINEIIETSITIIEEKVSVLQEIETIISAQKFEQKFMNAIPFIIIFYIEITAKGFFSVLYNNLFGRIVMTVCMILYLFSVQLSNKITNITI